MWDKSHDLVLFDRKCNSPEGSLLKCSHFIGESILFYMVVFESVMAVNDAWRSTWSLNCAGMSSVVLTYYWSFLDIIYRAIQVIWSMIMVVAFGLLVCRHELVVDNILE